ncbi:MAG: DUF2065 domain-containing protein [Syntrophobacteraceae bacterium]
MHLEYLVTMVGLICFFEGLPYLAFPSQLKAWLEQMTKMPNSRLRTLGAFMMLMGLVLVYWGRKHGG